MVKTHYAEFFTALVVTNQRYNQSLSNNYTHSFLESSKRISNNYDCPFPKISKRISNNYAHPFSKLNKKASSNYNCPFGRKESDSEHSAQKFLQENSQLSTIPSCATASCNIHIHSTNSSCATASCNIHIHFTQPIVVPTNGIS